MRAYVVGCPHCKIAYRALLAESRSIDDPPIQWKCKACCRTFYVTCEFLGTPKAWPGKVTPYRIDRTVNSVTHSRP